MTKEDFKKKIQKRIEEIKNQISDYDLKKSSVEKKDLERYIEALDLLKEKHKKLDTKYNSMIADITDDITEEVSDSFNTHIDKFKDSFKKIGSFFKKK